MAGETSEDASAINATTAAVSQTIPKSPKIIYFTDGSALPNPGWGGFAVIRDGEPYIIGGEPDGSVVAPDQTTNIRMEGMAILNALRDSAGMQAEINTDSLFWINVITKWAPGWAKQGWKKRSGEIQNLDLVQAVYGTFLQRSHATLKWVHGHNGVCFNEMADKWAKEARDRRLTNPVYVAEL